MRTPLRLRPTGIVLGLLTLFTLTTVPAPARAQFGGMGAADPKPEGDVQIVLVPKHPAHPVPAAVARTWLKLLKSVDFPFAQETPLEEVLKFIADVAREKGPDGKDESLFIFYVDPIGLQEAEKTMTSPVVMDLKQVSIATGLELALKQLGLVLNIHKDGIVEITAAQSDHLTEYSVPLSASEARTWLKLHRPAAKLAFRESPLSDVLDAIQKATIDKDCPSGINIYVDPDALEETEASLDSKVTLKLEGVPLATSLALVTKQLGLDFRVQEDGIVMIVSAEDDEDESLPAGHGAETIAILKARLEEAKIAAEIARYKAMAENPVMMGPQGGMGGGMRSVPAR